MEWIPKQSNSFVSGSESEDPFNVDSDMENKFPATNNVKHDEIFTQLSLVQVSVIHNLRYVVAVLHIVKAA